MKRTYVKEVDKNPKKDGKTERYSTKQKYKAVVLYKAVGVLRIVAEHTGIPEDTIYTWHKQDWWKEIEEELRQEARAGLSGNLQKVVDKAFTEVEDRLTNGDYIYDQKQGKMIRKPLGAHTVNQILKDSLDKTFLLEKLQKEDKKQETDETIAQRLLKLSEEFQRFTKAKEIKLDALYDERTPGLQEGEPAVQLETGGSPQEGSPEQGESALPEDGEGSQGGQSPSGSQGSPEQGGFDFGQQPEGQVSSRERELSPE